METDVETGERLAAYLAGELDATETAALEAELGRDPSLRARLEAIRSTDAALAALPTVEPPAGFSERLRAAVSAELDEQLGTADGSAGVAADELADRRGRRAARGGTAGTRSWWPQIAVAAAVLAVAGVGLSQLTTGSGADSGAEMATGEAGETESADSMIAMAPPAAGPTVVAAGRSFDAETLRELADDARFSEVVGQGLEGEAAAETATEFGDAFGSAEAGDGGAGGGSDESRIAEDAPATLESESGGAAVGLRTVGEVSPEDLDAVSACLPELLEAQTAVIPVYAELVTFEGQDAIVYGLVGNDPRSESYSRIELWVVGRDDCQPLHFTQVDR